MKRIYLILISTLLLINCGNELAEKENDTLSNILIEAHSENDSLVNEINKIDEEINSLKKNTDTSWFPKTSDTVLINKKANKPKEESKKTETSEPKKEAEKSNPIDSSLIKKEEPAITPTQIVEENHVIFDKLLKKYVSSSGKVNYKGFKADKQKLESYIKHMQVLYKDLKVWNKNKRLAYWINVYNANTIKLILDNYPVTSITKLKNGKPWDYKIIELGDKKYTLNDIENKIIRPRFKEPRIHFAVNCAAKSCPKLLNKAWTEHNIQRYLTKQTKAFLANTKENTITENKVVLSKIFDWYKADFGGDNAKLIAFINKYSNTKVNENAKVSFNEYVWDLNQ